MKQQHAGLQRIAGTCCSHIIIPEGPKRQRLHQMPTRQAEQTAGGGWEGAAPSSWGTTSVGHLSTAGGTDRGSEPKILQPGAPGMGRREGAAGMRGHVGRVAHASLPGNAASSRGRSWRCWINVVCVQKIPSEACQKSGENKSVLEALDGGSCQNNMFCKCKSA